MSAIGGTRFSACYNFKNYVIEYLITAIIIQLNASYILCMFRKILLQVQDLHLKSLFLKT